nr:hypothetical protein [uncultured organism]
MCVFSGSERSCTVSVLVAPLTPREKLSVSVFLLGRRDLTHTLTSVDTRQLQERRGSGPELREKQAVPFPTLCHVGSIEAPSSVTPPRKSKQRNVARQRHEKISGVWSCRSLQGTCKVLASPTIRLLFADLDAKPDRASSPHGLCLI